MDSTGPIQLAHVLEEMRLLREELATLRADLAAQRKGLALGPKAYTIPEASKLLGGISRSAVYSLIYAGNLKRVPDLRRVLITRQSLDEYLQAA